MIWVWEEEYWAMIEIQLGERGLVDPDADEALLAVVDRPPELEGMCTL